MSMPQIKRQVIFSGDALDEFNSAAKLISPQH